MYFEIEKFKMGINENGFHFQDPETGVMFSLVKVEEERLYIAICSESANTDQCENLKNDIIQCRKKYGLEDECVFGDIELEECYISNSNCFELKDIVAEGIRIYNRNTEKTIEFVNIEKGKPVIVFGLETDYGYEETTKEIFEICENDIQIIKAGTYREKVEIERSDDLQTIRQKLLKGLVEGVRKIALLKSATEPEYEIQENRVTIKIDRFSKVKIKDLGSIWMVDETENIYPIRSLIYTIEAVKKFPDVLKNVCFKYKFENKIFEITITPESTRKVLKKAIKKQIIDLTVV